MVLKNIVRLCKEKGISICKLEKECGIGNGTISRWEKSSPTVDSVRKVADYLNVPLAVLLQDE